MEISKKTLFAILLITVVVTVPVAYSATEPSIIINMIFGQTEKPLIVKDNLGVEVFSVDVDGTIFPAPVSAPSTENPLIFRVNTQSNVEFTVAVGDIETNPKLLQSFTINRNGIQNLQLYILDSSIVGEVRRDSGSGSCKLGWIQSTDNRSTWFTFIDRSSTSASFNDVATASNIFLPSQSVTDIGFAIFNSDGATTCTFRNMVSNMPIMKPDGYDFVDVP